MQFKEKVSTIKKHLLTGTSHMIPFIVAGGVLFSLAVMLNPEGAATPGTGWLGENWECGIRIVCISIRWIYCIFDCR